ncbi:MAG: NAD(+) synthase [Spirochaetales bacterium]|nr:NAD(+) synthase [Spirochaetales bacterium]
MNYGYIKIAVAIPQTQVADIKFNQEEILRLISKSEKNSSNITLFPELCITSYTCGDLFYQKKLLSAAVKSLLTIAEQTKELNGIYILGLPILTHDMIFNCAAVVSKGEIHGIIPKTHIPNTNEFYEARWFSSSRAGQEIKEIEIENKIIPFGTDLIFEIGSAKFGVEICEDLWVANPPSTRHSENGANILLNLSASNELLLKDSYRRQIIQTQSAKTISAYIYASSGVGESTTDTVFSGTGYIVENGYIKAEIEPFSNRELIIADIDIEKLEHDRTKSTFFKQNPHNNLCREIGLAKSFTNESITPEINPQPFVPQDPSEMNNRCNEIFNIQAWGLIKRLKHTGISKAVIGISGGLDSTLALLATYKAFTTLGLPTENIIAITMPGFGTTNRTKDNSLKLMNFLNVKSITIPIDKACIQHFKDIDHDKEIHDVTYENTQARERTQILMNIANKEAALVIGTGDMSELALGWATYNGDHMSMYGINSGIPKTLVKHLVKWFADNTENTATQRVLYDILDTPVSPELLPPKGNGTISQETENIVGPYRLHDYFLFYFLRYGFSPKKIFFLAKATFKNEFSEEEILKWMKIFFRRFFSQQFKRSCLPDGPKIGSINLSPRGDWRMPSDASAKLWLEELEEIKV